MGPTQICSKTSLLILMLLLAPILYGGDMQIGSRFKDVHQIKEWAESAFVGGYEINNFSKNNKQVLALLGHPTSGYPGDNFWLFVKNKKSEYVLILIRAWISGSINVKECSDGICLFMNEDIKMLSIPWDGLVDGHELDPGLVMDKKKKRE